MPSKLYGSNTIWCYLCEF